MKQHLRTIHSLIIPFLYISLPLLSEHYAAREYVVTGICLVVCATFLCLRFGFEKRRAISFSATDGWVAAFAFYILLRNLMKGDVDPAYYYFMLLGGMLYFIGRTSTAGERTALFYGIILSGVVQSVVGLLQFSGILCSNHTAFRLTGSFQNPGMLGGYLACSMLTAMAVLALLPRQKQSGKITLCASLALMGLVCLLSDSRAAWLAVVVVTIAIVARKIETKRRSKLIGISLAGVLLVVGLYLYKPKSADSRILIWKVCASMLLDKPIFGHGADAVRQNYAPYLAKQLRKSANKQEQELAADNTYAFNEPLRIGCENGIIGIVLAGGIFLTIVRGRKQTSHRIAIYPMAGFGLFSLFSYPLGCLPLAALLPLATGMAASGKSRFNIRQGQPILLLLFVSGTLCFLPEWKRNNQLTTMLFAFRHEALFEADLQRAYPQFKHQTRPVFRYATILFQQENYAAALPVWQQAAKLCPTNRIYCNLGYCYQQTGNYQEAEQTYLLASATYPTYLTPRYRLFKLYLSQKREAEAKQIAVEIGRMKVKIENDATRNMKKEVLHYLQTSFPGF
ncbi:MAG: Wzy polymerase domain-containing protein [Prevotellaceae bacterium]|jgi:O-antigen ligase|nr:Wzy polymerase domain-containing protein [Prevotellaceae bacterium]